MTLYISKSHDENVAAAKSKELERYAKYILPNYIK